MSKIHRKVVPLCRPCHIKVPQGKLSTGWTKFKKNTTKSDGSC